MKRYLLLNNGEICIKSNGNKITDGFENVRRNFSYIDNIYLLDAGSQLIYENIITNIKKESIAMMLDGIGKRNRELILSQDKGLIDYYKRKQEYIKQQQEKVRSEEKCCKDYFQHNIN